MLTDDLASELTAVPNTRPFAQYEARVTPGAVKSLDKKPSVALSIKCANNAMTITFDLCTVTRRTLTVMFFLP